MRIQRISVVVVFLLPLILTGMIGQMPNSTQHFSDGAIVDLGDGNSVLVAPDEILTKHVISANPTQQTGYGSALNGSEFGDRTDTFLSNSMDYDSVGSSTTTTNLSVPMGAGWNAYNVSASLTEVTEERMWVNNSDLADASEWSFLTYDAPSEFGPSFTTGLSSSQTSGYANFSMDGYQHYANASFWGDWYDEGDKAYIQQDLDLPRGEVVWMAVSLDYWADQNWGGNPTGFFETFLSIGDPDSGGSYLWQKDFDLFANDAQWFSTGLITADTTNYPSANLSIWAGLRVTQTEWYRSSGYYDILPEAHLDDVEVYIKTKVAPSSINMEMNGESISNVTNGPSTVFGQGTITQDVTSYNWNSETAYANFSWYPSFTPSSPNLDMTVEFDVSITVFARRYNVFTMNDTVAYTLGSDFVIENATDVAWETSYPASVPGGYSEQYRFNLSIPINRDITYVASPEDRWVNLTSGWNLGAPGDGVVNVSAYSVTQDSLDGFWRTQGTSPNIISNLWLYDYGANQWVSSSVLRANENTRFNASVPTEFNGATVAFTLYNPSSQIWISQQAVVVNGFAATSDINLASSNASTGTWEIQAFVVDNSDLLSVENVGYYIRQFSIQHSTQMSVFYPVGSADTWSSSAVYGTVVYFKFAVSDADNGLPIPGGAMTYSWDGGSGIVTDLQSGEYSVDLDTDALSGNGGYAITLTWQKPFYDPIVQVFTLNVTYDTFLLTSVQKVDVPNGDDAVFDLHYKDQNGNPITDATIICNWTADTYDVTPVIGNPGHYTLRLETDSAPISLYTLNITATKDYFQTRSINRAVDVRELLTDATPSESYIPLPVGYSASINITYTDYDHDIPMTGRASSIRCNWSDIHAYGDQNYTVIETGNPGIYEVTFYSKDTDALDAYSVVFTIGSFGVQNQTFTVTVNLETHLTSFYLVNSITPTPYTGNIAVYVMYFDIDAQIGIENGSTVGYNVLVTVESSGLPSVTFSVVNGSTPGEYIVLIPASQWGSIGTKDITINVNWAGPTAKYTDESITKNVLITGTPSSIFIDESPLITPYGENITFTIVYYDLANDTGITNQTSIYGQHVHLIITVLTTGETLTQADMVITEVDPSGQPGVYRIEFNTSLLTGVVDLQMRIWLNWTQGQLPLYENQTLLVTTYTTYRQTTIDWNPLPVTPYDELVNLTVVFRDFLTGDAILNGTEITISIQEAVTYVVLYEGDATGIFQIEIDSSSWTPGTHTFNLDIQWVGTPFYRNSTTVITIIVRERYADLIHGSYVPIQYENNLTILFTYRDLDDFTSSGMDGNTLTLDAWLSPYYTVYDNGDGTYTVKLMTSAFSGLGIYIVNATMTYDGTRQFIDASDFFYLEIIPRKTQLTSELPQLAPYKTFASINVTYSDDNNGTGIENANVYVTSSNVTVEVLELGVNYWVSDQGNGIYLITINTESLGSFGSYAIIVTVNWTEDTKPFYVQRIRIVDIEVSRRPASLSVSSSPFNTPYLENFTFQITATDNVDDSGIELTKDVLILSYGSGTIITNSQYILTGSAGSYTIEINSTLVTSILISDLSIFLKMFWGDSDPFYTNATASTEVSITARFTQASVISTPPAFYYYNSTVILSYSDYLTGVGLSGAMVDYSCLNTSSFTSWIEDLGDGTYKLIINTTSLSSLGRFYFKVNFTTFGAPYHQNLTDLTFSITVNPVSTILTIEFPASAIYYLGDTVVGNITYKTISTDIGIDTTDIGTDWGFLYGTSYDINSLGNGVYNFTVETSGLNAGLFVFKINASKYLHQGQEITVDILIAAIPVEIILEYSPTDPSWGDDVLMQANVTDARSGDAIIGADVNMTIDGFEFVMNHIGGGIYEYTLNTSILEAGDFEIVVHFELTNHEDRDRDFQIRIGKISSALDASLTPIVAVNGQILGLTANYSILTTGLEIDIGSVSFTWIGGSGFLSWDSDSNLYVGNILVDNAPVGNHFILVTASSDNYKSVSLQISVEIREVSTSLVSFDGSNVITTPYSGSMNVTVFLNNTDLNSYVESALVSYSIGDVLGNLTYLGDGYYSVIVSTSQLDIGTWTLTVYSSKDGYAPSSFEFTVNIERIVTRIILLSDAFQEVYYGQNVTFVFKYLDISNNSGVANASSSYVLESFGDNLVELGNGNYSLTLNSSLVAAGAFPYDISLSFQKDNYQFVSTTVRLLVNPIPTQIIGSDSIVLPVGDSYNIVFTFEDVLHGEIVSGAVASAIWEFGSDTLSVLENGSFVLSSSETGISRLEIRDTPYQIRIIISKGNYSRSELLFSLRIRPIATELQIVEVPSAVFAGYVFTIRVTYFDFDHQVPIVDASNSTGLADLMRVADQEVDLGNGTYIFAFFAQSPGVSTLEISMSKSDYAEGHLSIPIFSEYSPEYLSAVQGFAYVTIGLFALAAVGALWIRVLSVPKMLRRIRSMIKALSKGNIPTPPLTRDRRRVLLDIMNEDLEVIGIAKTTDDVSRSTIEVEALDTDDLLNELAILIGLTESDVAVLKRDLDGMRPSEQPGFLMEVIKQERARRVPGVAETPTELVETPEEEPLSETELYDLRIRFVALGIDKAEVDIMIEQAKVLSRAEIEALLNQIGGMGE